MPRARALFIGLTFEAIIAIKPQCGDSFGCQGQYIAGDVMAFVIHLGGMYATSFCDIHGILRMKWGY